jgi:hypothetical protein
LEQQEFPTKLCVVTWLWTDHKAKGQFKPYHVARWARMLRDNLDMPHRAVVITDQVEAVHEACLSEGVAIETHQIWDAPVVKSKSWGAGRPQCYRRARIFDPHLAKTFGEYIVSMDLDVVILGKIDYLFKDFPDFRIMRGGNPRNPYNGSMWMFKWDARPQVWKQFSPVAAQQASAQFMGSDQAWFRFILGPHERIWTMEQDGTWQFVHLQDKTGTRRQQPSTARIMFFAGPKKPWHANVQRLCPWIAKHYGTTPEIEEQVPRVLASVRRRQKGGLKVSDLIGRESSFDLADLPEETPGTRGWPGPHEGAPLWCYKDPGGWGFALFLEGLKRGWDARMFTQVHEVDVPGYVFYRIPQIWADLEHHKKGAEKLRKMNCTLIPDFGMIEEYEDKVMQHLKYPDWVPQHRIHRAPSLAINHAKEGPFPIVSKSKSGSSSHSVRLLKNAAQAAQEVHTVFGVGLPTASGERQKGYLLWEEFLHGNDYVYRVNRIGSQHFIFKVLNRDKMPLASGSGKVEMVDPTAMEPASALAFAKDFFDAINTKWCAIDIMRDHTRFKWRVIETSLAWTMHKPFSNPQATFVESGKKVAWLFDTLCEEIEAGVFKT